MPWAQKYALRQRDIKTLQAQMSGHPKYAQLKTLWTQTLRWLEKPHHCFIVPEDPRYPKHFQALQHPPLGIYWTGSTQILTQKTLAVVGSRQVSEQAIQSTKIFTAYWTSGDIAIISGLAHGIDTAAHQAALDTQGQTLAILGGGLEVIYPASNAELAEKILLSDGALASEYSPYHPPQRWQFLARNRLIAALGDATAVMAAHARSGAMHTALMALDCGKDVFAVPGNIADPEYRGCTRLLQSGAHILEHPENITPLLWPGHTFFRQMNSGLQRLCYYLKIQRSSTTAELCRTTMLKPAFLAPQLYHLQQSGLITNNSPRWEWRDPLDPL